MNYLEWVSFQEVCDGRNLREHDPLCVRGVLRIICLDCMHVLGPIRIPLFPLHVESSNSDHSEPDDETPDEPASGDAATHFYFSLLLHIFSDIDPNDLLSTLLSTRVLAVKIF